MVLTIPEIAAMCRDHCRLPAQGFDDGTACGSVGEDKDGERVYRFCGRHWAMVL